MWLSVVGLVFAGTANAAVQQGDTELELQTSFLTEDASGSSGIDMKTAAVAGGLGYFVTDNLQLVGSAFGLWSNTDQVSVGSKTSYDIKMYGLGTKVRWFFMPRNQFVPYVGAHLSYVDADVDTATRTRTGGVGAKTKTHRRPDGVLWGPLVGVRFELNANNEFFAEYQYHVWDGDIGRTFEDGHALFVGIVHKFSNIGSVIGR
jgi:outer membrane protein W